MVKDFVFSVAQKPISVIHWRQKLERDGQMHIPGCLTTETGLLDLDRALEAALALCPDGDVSKWLYVPNTYQEYR